jgi:hypothetical protein
MENMKLDFFVSHNYTQRDLPSSSAAAAALLLLLLLRRRRRPPPTLFFRIEKNYSGIVFLLETLQVGIKFTISFI